MPDETETQNEIIDLGYDASDADITRPVLQGGSLRFKIQRTYKENSSKKGIPTLVVVHALAQMAKDSKGRDVNPGFTLFQRILLQPTGGYTEEMKKTRLSQIHFATGGKAGEKPNTGNWIGKEVILRVNLREPHTDKDTGQSYDESNEIVKVMPVK